MDWSSNKIVFLLILIFINVSALFGSNLDDVVVVSDTNPAAPEVDEDSLKYKDRYPQPQPPYPYPGGGAGYPPGGGYPGSYPGSNKCRDTMSNCKEYYNACRNYRYECRRTCRLC